MQQSYVGYRECNLQHAVPCNKKSIRSEYPPLRKLTRQICHCITKVHARRQAQWRKFDYYGKSCSHMHSHLQERQKRHSKLLMHDFMYLHAWTCAEEIIEHRRPGNICFELTVLLMSNALSTPVHMYAQCIRTRTQLSSHCVCAGACVVQHQTASCLRTLKYSRRCRP